MADGNFLPEADQDFLAAKEVGYRLLREGEGEAEQRGIEFLDFPLPANLYVRENGELRAGQRVSVMVPIPKGYDKVRLDSWYVWPPVFLAGGRTVDRAGSEATMFGQTWQFWSRHLDDADWREGIDGLETYLQYIRAGLRDAQ